MSVMPERCPSEVQLLQLVRGELADAEAVPAADHLETCSTCGGTLRRLSRELDPLIALLRTPLPAGAEQRAAEPELRTAIAQLLSSQRMRPLPDLSVAAAGDSTGERSAAGLPQAQAGDPEAGIVLPELPDRYRILRQLGRGGMGTVWLAEDQELGRRVALKVPFASAENGPQDLQRFRREARAAARLQHPHICPVFDVGEAEGVHFLTMAFIDGRTLAEELRVRGPLPVAEALRIVRQVADALQYAHDEGMVHRDLKPANIMLNGRGEPVVTDFGLARQTGLTEQITQTGQVLGTPAYMAPEQFRGEPAAISSACDVCSLGTILYALLTGGPPYSGDVLSIVSRIALQAPEPPSRRRADLPTGVDAVCLKAMARNPQDRYESMAALAQAIGSLEARLAAPSPAVPATAAEGGRSSGFRRWLAGALTVSLLLFAAGIIYLTTDHGTIVVDTPDPDVQIRIRRHETDAGTTYRLNRGENRFSYRSGRYEVVLTGAAADEWSIDGETVVLTRNGRHVVRLERRPEGDATPRGLPPDAEQPATAGTTPAGPLEQPSEQPSEREPDVVFDLSLPDREKPFVVLDADGNLRTEERHFVPALAAIQDGEVLEIHGHGPFPIAQTVNLGDRHITIRSARGYLPRLARTHSSRGMLNIQGGSLRVEGCELHCPERAYRATAMFTIQNGRLELVSSRISGARGQAGIVALSPGELHVENCLVSCQGTLFAVQKSGSHLRLVNNLIDSPMVVLLQEMSRATSVSAEANSFCHMHPGFLTMAHNVVPRTDIAPHLVEASRNCFALGFRGAVIQQSLQFPTDLSRYFIWQGTDNHFSFRHRESGLYSDRADWHRELERWQGFAGFTESGSATDLFLGYRWQMVDLSPQDLQDLLMSDISILRNGRPLLRNLGPDWNRIGPGDAYVRVLRARGDDLPDSQLRPPAPVDGPFLRLKDGETLAACPTLQEAFADAADADTIEIRGDGPFAGGELPSWPEPAQLTLRAAPGYRPVITSDIAIGANRTVTVEGLHFRNARLYGQAVLARLANCSWEGREPSGRSVHEFRLPPADHPPAEIANCVAPGEVTFAAPDADRLVVTDSVMSCLQFDHRNAPDTPLQLEIRNSMLLAYGEVPRPAIEAPGRLLTVSATDSVFEFGTFLAITFRRLHDAHGVLTSTPEQFRLTWQGKRNVYRTGAASWLPAWSDGEVVAGIDVLRERWNSPETGSIAADPLAFSPQRWQVVPADPDRALIGADLSRIPRFPIRIFDQQSSPAPGADFRDRTGAVQTTLPAE